MVSGGGFLSGGGPPGADVGLTSPVVTTYDLDQLRDIDGTRAVIPRGSVPISSLTYANETVTPGSLTATTAESFDDEMMGYE